MNKFIVKASGPETPEGEEAMEAKKEKRDKGNPPVLGKSGIDVLADFVKAGGGPVAVGKRGGKIYGYDAKGKPIYSKKEVAKVKGAKQIEEWGKQAEPKLNYEAKLDSGMGIVSDGLVALQHKKYGKAVEDFSDAAKKFDEAVKVASTDKLKTKAEGMKKEAETLAKKAEAAKDKGETQKPVDGNVVDEASAQVYFREKLGKKIREAKSTIELRNLEIRSQVVGIYSGIFGLAATLVHGSEVKKYLGNYTDKRIDTMIAKVLYKEFPKLLEVLNQHNIASRVWVKGEAAKDKGETKKPESGKVGLEFKIEERGDEKIQVLGSDKKAALRDSIPGLAKDLNDLGTTYRRLKAVMANVSIPNLTEKGAISVIEGLSATIKNKLKNQVSKMYGEAEKPGGDRYKYRTAIMKLIEFRNAIDLSTHGILRAAKPDKKTMAKVRMAAETSNMGDLGLKEHEWIAAHPKRFEIMAKKPEANVTQDSEKLAGYLEFYREEGQSKKNLGNLMADSGMNLERTTAVLENLGYEIKKEEGGDPRGYIEFAHGKGEAGKTKKSLDSPIEILNTFGKAQSPETPEEEEAMEAKKEKQDKGNPPPLPAVKKSGIEELKDFVKAQTLPEGGPKKELGQGEEQGGKLAGVGVTSGSGDSAASPPIGAPAPKKEKLSEDEEEDEKQLKPHKKPIETAKSMSIPMNQRAMVAQENAVAVSRLRKGEAPVLAGVGVATPMAAAPESLEKAVVWNQGADSRVSYSNQSDLACERLLKSDKEFYPMGSPTIGRNSMLVNQRVMCPACKGVMAKSLAVCPHCGTGARSPVVSSLSMFSGDSVVLQKSAVRVLRPAKREVDVYIPNGGIADDTE